MIKTFFFTLSLAVLLSSGAFAQEKKGPPITTVGTDKVAYRQIAQTIPLSGRLVSLQTGQVAARINAPVGNIVVEVGDQVQQDQLLVELVAERLKHQKDLALGEAERTAAALRTTRAELNIVSAELKRLERLKKSAAFNQARFDDQRLKVLKAQSAIGEAQAAVRKANADLALAELNLDHTQIRAPFSGTITTKLVNAGDYVNVGQAVLQLVNAEKLEVEADVPNAYLNTLKPGIEVAAQLADKQMLSFKVRAVVPDENPLTRTRAVRFSALSDLSSFALASNQTIKVLLPVGKQTKALSVHKDAILNKKGKQVVYALKDGKAHITPVKLGEALGGYFAVVSGLSEGDIVVVRGNERLRPGQAIQSKGE